MILVMKLRLVILTIAKRTGKVEESFSTSGVLLDYGNC